MNQVNYVRNEKYRDATNFPPPREGSCEFYPSVVGQSLFLPLRLIRTKSAVPSSSHQINHTRWPNPLLSPTSGEIDAESLKRGTGISGCFLGQLAPCQGGSAAQLALDPAQQCEGQAGAQGGDCDQCCGTWLGWEPRRQEQFGVSSASGTKCPKAQGTETWAGNSTLLPSGQQPWAWAPSRAMRGVMLLFSQLSLLISCMISFELKWEEGVSISPFGYVPAGCGWCDRAQAQAVPSKRRSPESLVTLTSSHHKHWLQISALPKAALMILSCLASDISLHQGSCQGLGVKRECLWTFKPPLN